MDLDRAIKASVGLGLIFNGVGLNKYVKNLEMDNCSKVNLHMGLSAMVLAGVLKTYRALRC